MRRNMHCHEIKLLLNSHIGVVYSHINLILQDKSLAIYWWEQDPNNFINRI